VTRMRTGAGAGLAGGPVTMEDMLKTVSVGCSYAVRAPRGVAGLDVAQHPWVVAKVESFVEGHGVPLSVKVAEALSLEPDSAAFKRIENVTAKAALWLVDQESGMMTSIGDSRMDTYVVKVHRAGTQLVLTQRGGGLTVDPQAWAGAIVEAVVPTVSVGDGGAPVLDESVPVSNEAAPRAASEEQLR